MDRKFIVILRIYFFFVIAASIFGYFENWQGVAISIVISGFALLGMIYLNYNKKKK